MTARTPPPDAPGGAPADPAASRLARLRATRWWRWGRWPLLAGGALGALGLLGFAWLYATVELPDEPPQLESSVVLDAQGDELAVLERDGLRVEVTLDEVAPVAVEALIAAEDRSFRDHPGVDVGGIIRAFTNNVGGGDTQGGSTITQQLVKNSYLDSDRTYSRKVREAVLALKLDRSEDKDEILERYFNTVYFGRGTYGIEAAARVYFDTTAAELTVPQAALLIGLLRAPESADPTTDPDEARERRDSVIDDLVEVGEVTEAEATEAKAADLGATPLESPTTLSAGVGAHVVEWIRGQVVEQLGAEAVYGGGLTIHTTIDIADQRAAEEAVAAALTDPDDPQAALVAVDGEGRIRAHVGGRDFEALQVDLARGAEGGGTGRQPGSTFKPVVLAGVLEDELATLATTYPAPGSISLDAGGEPWEVDNAGGTDLGVLDVHDATARSANTVYAQMVLELGPERAAELARALGVRTEVAPDPSLVLGTGEVSVLDMASLYSTLAREGRRIDPYVIERVEHDGRTVSSTERPEPAQAISSDTALGVTHALRAVIEGGTGEAARLDRPAAGKTGTTQDNVDAWFAGYVPTYTAVVWMGHPEGAERPMEDVDGEAVSGGSIPARIWQAFMTRALEDVEPADFPPPPDRLLQPLEGDQPELEVSPASAAPGATVTVRGTGFEDCIDSWSVALDPGGASSPPQVGSTADERTATLVVPEGLGAGRARVVATCDRGAGPEAVAEVDLTIEGPATTTTTTTTTTEPPPPTSSPAGPAPPSTGPSTTRPPTTTTAPAPSAPSGPAG